MFTKLCILLLAVIATVLSERVDYTGHKVFRVTPKTREHSEFLHKLRTEYNIDFWNEPRVANVPVLFRLKPDEIKTVEDTLTKYGMEHDVVFHDLQSTIEAERVMNAPTKNDSHAVNFDFGRYHQYNEIVSLLDGLAKQYPNLAQLVKIADSYERRPIYNMKISSGSGANKPAIMIECGIHAREWISVATCSYLVNKLVTTYGSEGAVTTLLNQYEFNIVVEANPDGYEFTWSGSSGDRLWRKTRSRSNAPGARGCLGADANRNFDIEHCGVGTSSKPCDEIYCGDAPFSELEARALRDLMIALGSRLKIYFSIHAFSQLWMTPYGTTKSLPPNYSELYRVAKFGVDALARRYGTRYQLGPIALIIYEATGSSVDYAYVKQGVRMAYALELRDTGAYGFLLPANQIIPTAIETCDGLFSAILQLKPDSFH